MRSVRCISNYISTKRESERAIAWHQYRKIMWKRKDNRSKRKFFLFKLQPNFAWRQQYGKKEGIKGEFTNEEVLEYVQNLIIYA